jgi:hypothetical protein
MLYSLSLNPPGTAKKNHRRNGGRLKTKNKKHAQSYGQMAKTQ